jgi:hypothetical protein
MLRVLQVAEVCSQMAQTLIKVKGAMRLSMVVWEEQVKAPVTQVVEMAVSAEVVAQNGIMSPEAEVAVDIAEVKEVTPMGM